ncbi:MAG: DUF839 domain-containing protein [Pegethrix bostrychoides GSE-TBD4-15B]|jgi:hypothetical protein|uniref:DUF839 domain-containing protein n=1 Tax=Pegethrix bostrychoides GSE-TBD4-15B TaxID=2839662 RepID=A0A951PBA2_9CYAN|nr:DUF839 domain-containing protein [Pegethrix bostrychoides GSE-TBD4-15B]
MAIKRRHFLAFLGASAGSLALSPLSQRGGSSALAEDAIAQTMASPIGNLSFKPIKGPMPLAADGLERLKQISDYSQFTVADDLLLPEGYTYDVIVAWGDQIGQSDYYGSNNDYISYVETSPGEGFLTINHEYISAKPWAAGYQQVIGRSLPFAEVRAIAETMEDGKIDAFALPDGDPLKEKIRAISRAGQYEQGMSVISVRRKADGGWERTYSNADRRISGIAGLEDGKYLKSTGPAAAVFRKTSGQGYIDGLGDKIIGTHQNCAGGTTPWGTALSAEENFQGEVADPVYADGTAFSPSKTPFQWVTAEGEIEDIAGQGNALGYQGNKYGWIVEVDPANPNDYGTKHTWMGRYRHEAVGIRVDAGKKLAFYSGCDRRGGHLYKFVSSGTVINPKDKANSQLLSDGMLYAAKFNPDGTGSWIPLKADTPINPDLPSVHVGKMIMLPNPDRAAGGTAKVEEDAAIASFKQQFKQLGDLYQGNAEELQGAILIDAHYAASAAGATCTARPEDTEVNAQGSLFVTFTSGAPSSSDGSPDARVFKGPNGETPYEYGWVMRLDETANDPAAMTFAWSMFATGGEPAEGGLGFANPDNVAIDNQGNIWVVTDMSTDKHNKAVPSRIDKEGKAVSQSNLRGLFGNNSIWFIPASGPNAGEAYLFGFGPMDSEMTGPFFTADEKTLFLAAQHPGEYGGIRQDMAVETRQYAMRTADGEEFMQVREVPIGSNWPSKQINAPARSAVVAVRRLDGMKLT